MYRVVCLVVSNADYSALQIQFSTECEVQNYEHQSAFGKVMGQSIMAHFYPSNAMPAHVIVMSVSVTRWNWVKMADLIRLVFGLKASLRLSCAVLKRNSIISKNKGTSIRNFFPKSGLQKILPRLTYISAVHKQAWTALKSFLAISPWQKLTLIYRDILVSDSLRKYSASNDRSNNPTALHHTLNFSIYTVSQKKQQWRSAL